MGNLSSVLRPLQSVAAVAILGGLLSGALLVGLRSFGVFESVELSVYDRLLRSRPGNEEPDPRIVLLLITDKDIRRQERWPITDAVMATVLQRLVKGQPRAIGIDIYRDIEVPPGRGLLNNILLEHPNIIGVKLIGGRDSQETPAPLVLIGTDQVGFGDLVLDRDGVVRRALLFQDDGEDVGYAFALRLALRYLDAEGITPEPDPANPDHIKLGPTTFPPLGPNEGGYVDADVRGYQVLLDYRGRYEGLHTYSLADVLSAPPESVQGDDALEVRDKVVLIGTAARTVPDEKNTPYGMMNGVEVHAHILSQLMRGALEGERPRAFLSNAVEHSWVILWGLFGGLAGLALRTPWRLVAGMAAGLIFLVGTAVLGFWTGWWLPLLAPALAWFIPTGLVTAKVLQVERRDRAVLRQLFDQHVSEEVAETIWRQRDQFLQDGHIQSRQFMATVLFADFSGYTAVAANMEPNALMDWLNSYLDLMTRMIMDHQGIVDDYAGDAIKANFFSPLKGTSGMNMTHEEVARDAINAVSCAVEMGRRLQDMNARHRAQGLPTIGMRIGIYTGPIVAGSVGSTQRMKFTTVGDSVNTAARLESMDRDIVSAEGTNACRVLVGEATVSYVKDLFALQQVGELSIRGKLHPIQVFELTGPRSDGSSQSLPPRQA